ncbi:MAG: hypothetical protein FWC87_13810 [Acidimicrobiaceae bacterium]|nr:hypothetical protein [Acidimicrobiaceae bacterium]
MSWRVANGGVLPAVVGGAGRVVAAGTVGEAADDALGRDLAAGGAPEPAPDPAQPVTPPVTTAITAMGATVLLANRRRRRRCRVAAGDLRSADGR